MKQELERRVSERTSELSKAMSLLNATLEATADGLLVVDGDEKIVSYNRKFVEMWKIPDGVMELRDDAKAISFVLDQLSNPDAFVKKIKELYHHPEAESYDILQFKDGRIFERLSAPQKLDQSIVGRVWSFRDVTEKRKAEEALSVSEKKYRYLVETSQDLIWSVDVEGRWTYLNSHATKRIYGYEVEEMLGKSFLPFTLPSLIKKDVWAFEQIKKGVPVFQYETTHLRKDGKPVHLIFNAVVLKDEQGRAIGTTGTATDITPLKVAEEQLRVANNDLKKLSQIKSDFASMLSHELRTPLGVINESINVVCEGIDGPVSEEQKKTLNIARTNVERLTRLIDNILDLSKLEAGKMRMVYSPTPIKFLVEDVCMQMKPLSQKKSLQCSCELPAGELMIVCDADKVRQVLINLIDNAIKYTPQNGHILVRLEYTDDEVILIVRDSGMGIGKNDREKIFEMFGRTLNAELKVVDGFGVGLAVCKFIVQQHLGTLDVASEEGKGSCFTVRFPKNFNPIDDASDSETSGSFR